MRKVVTVCVVAAILLAAPAEGMACGFLDCLFGWCAPPAATTYRPAYVAASPVCAPACTPCAPQTCRYVPQTSYRTVCTRVPVTACQAVTGCDPCTGCPVTTYRPITTWTTQTRLVPYTTYRMVYSNPCTPCVSAPACGPCGPSVTYGSPAVSTIAAPSPCCGPGEATAVPSSGAASVPPVLNGTPGPETFESQKPATEDNKLKPIPETKSDTVPAGPQITPQSRETSLPVRQAVHFRLISAPSNPVPIHGARLNDGGWRASRD